MLRLTHNTVVMRNIHSPTGCAKLVSRPAGTQSVVVVVCGFARAPQVSVPSPGQQGGMGEYQGAALRRLDILGDDWARLGR